VKNQIKNKTIIALIAVAAVSVASFQLHGAAEVKPKYTIKQIMKALNKGETNVGKKVGKGEGTKADFAKLLEYYQYLPLNEPPQGDKVGWNTKTMAVLNAVKALNTGAPNALAAYKQAVNCKSCHSVYKPD